MLLQAGLVALLLRLQCFSQQSQAVTEQMASIARIGGRAADNYITDTLLWLCIL